MNNQDEGYLLSSVPYEEYRYRQTILSRNYGKITIFTTKKKQLKYLYNYEIIWSNNQIADLSVLAIHNLNTEKSFLSYYIIEWAYTFMQDSQANLELFSLFKNTLFNLEQSQDSLNYEKILRCYERKFLTILGYGLNIENIKQLNKPYILYHPENGYTGYDNMDEDNSCIEQHILIDILNDHYPNKETLKIAKKWIQSIVKKLLPQHEWKCRNLFLN